MTRKEYELIAQVFSNQKGTDEHGMDEADRYQMATALADEFEKANPRFDWWKFMRACDFDPRIIKRTVEL